MTKKFDVRTLVGKPTHPPETIARIRELLELGGQSQKAIAAEVGCSQTYVSLVKRDLHRVKHRWWEA